MILPLNRADEKAIDLSSRGLTQRAIGRRPRTAGPAPAAGPIGQRRALLIGINRYDDPGVAPLNFCIDDVCGLAKMLRELGYAVLAMHDQAQERFLLPTLGNVTANLETQCSDAGRDDLLLVYLACHGVRVDDETLLVMQDTRWVRRDGAPVLPRERALSLAVVEAALRGARARQRVLILDACHSGVQLGRDLGGALDEAQRSAILQDAYHRATGFALLAGSTAEQVALERQDTRHGAFTHFLLAGLAGEADVYGRGVVTVADLNRYVVREVNRWSIERGGLVQQPTERSEGIGIGDIVLADRRGAQAPEPAPKPASEPASEPRASAPMVRSGTAGLFVPWPRALDPVVQHCDRTEQWAQLQQLVEQRAVRLALLPGERGQGHRFLVDRMHALEQQPGVLVRTLRWSGPLPPPTRADYLDALAQTLGPGVAAEPAAVARALGALGSAHELVLLHPYAVYRDFTSQGPLDACLQCWREIVAALPPAQGGGAGTARSGEPGFMGVLCLQPLEWEPVRGLRRWLARRLGQPWPYPRAWVRDARTDVQALQLMAALRRQAAPPALLAVHPLPELSDITETDIRAFCDIEGLSEPGQSAFVRAVLDPPSEAQVTLLRMQENFERYRAESRQPAAPKET